MKNVFRNALGGRAIFSLILSVGGTELVPECKALRRRHLAASASRVGLKKNSSVFRGSIHRPIQRGPDFLS